MNVLYMLDSLGRGGAETMVLDICRNARDHDINITFLATGEGELEGEFRASGVDFVKAGRRLPVDPALIKAIRRIVSERNILIVHTNQPVEALHAYLASLGRPTKTVMTAHLLLLDAKNRLTARLVLPRLDRVFAVSAATMNEYREIGIDISNFVVLPNCVSSGRMATGASDIRGELGIGDKTPLAIMVGNFYAHRTKDQLTVCRAAAEVIETVPDLVVAFAGAVKPGGEDYYNDCVDQVRSSRIAGSVRFLGSRTDVPDILAAADILVHSSLSEGMPIGLIEAMFAGLPIVASDIGPIVETVGDSAVLFPAGDAGELAKQMAALLADDDKRRRLAASAKARAETLFSVDAHLRALKAHYEQLISQ